MITIIYSAIIVTEIFLITFFRTKFSSSGEFFEDSMSLDNTLPLRGIFAVIIATHHFSSEFTEPYLLGIFTHIGYLFVALFFFLSGYGLAFGYNRSANYLSPKSFLPKRFFNTVLPYWICLLFTAIFRAVLLSQTSISDFLLSFIFIRSIVKYSWYVYIILIMYAAFMVIFRIRNRKISMILMFVFTAAVMIVFIVKGNSIPARSTLSFYLGMLYCFYKEKIDSYIKKRFMLKAFAVSIIFAAFCAARYYSVVCGSIIADILFAILSSSVFSVFVFVFAIKKVRIGNRLLCFLGNASYEIYLLHGLFCDVFRFLNTNMLLYYLAVIVCSVLSAAALKALSSRINGFVFKKLPQGKKTV